MRVFFAKLSANGQHCYTVRIVVYILLFLVGNIHANRMKIISDVLVRHPDLQHVSHGFPLAASSQVIVASAPHLYTGEGRVYIFLRNGTTQWELSQTIVEEQVRAPLNFFGNSVDIDASGRTIVIGSNQNQATGWGGGVAYTYARESEYDNFVLVTRLDAPDTQSEDHFGHIVRIAPRGDTVVVGTSKRGSGGSKRPGSVYLFHRPNSSNNQWLRTRTLTAPTPIASDMFGSVLAITDTVLAVVAIHSNTALGYLYVYERDEPAHESEWSAQAIEVGAGDLQQHLGCGQALGISAGTIVLACHDASQLFVFVRHSAGTWLQTSGLATPASKTRLVRFLSFSSSYLIVGTLSTLTDNVYPGAKYAMYAHELDTNSFKPIPFDDWFGYDDGTPAMVDLDSFVIGVSDGDRAGLHLYSIVEDSTSMSSSWCSCSVNAGGNGLADVFADTNVTLGPHVVAASDAMTVVDDVTISSLLVSRNNYPIAYVFDEYFAVCWVEQSPGGGDTFGTALWLAIIDTTFNDTISPAVQVSTSTVSSVASSSLVSINSTFAFIAWYEAGAVAPGNDIMARFVSLDRAHRVVSLNDTFKVNQCGGGKNQMRPRAYTGADRIVVAWISNACHGDQQWRISARMYSVETGDALSSEVLVSDTLPGDAPHVHLAQNGSWVVTWAHLGGRYRRFLEFSTLEPIGTVHVVNSGLPKDLYLDYRRYEASRDDDLVRFDLNLRLFRTRDYHANVDVVAGQFFDTDGAAIAQEFVVFTEEFNTYGYDSSPCFSDTFGIVGRSSIAGAASVVFCAIVTGSGAPSVQCESIVLASCSGGSMLMPFIRGNDDVCFVSWEETVDAGRSVVCGQAFVRRACVEMCPTPSTNLSPASNQALATTSAQSTASSTFVSLQPMSMVFTPGSSTWTERESTSTMGGQSQPESKITEVTITLVVVVILLCACAALVVGGCLFGTRQRRRARDRRYIDQVLSTDLAESVTVDSVSTRGRSPATSAGTRARSSRSSSSSNRMRVKRAPTVYLSRSPAHSPPATSPREQSSTSTRLHSSKTRHSSSSRSPRAVTLGTGVKHVHVPLFYGM